MKSRDLGVNSEIDTHIEGYDDYSRTIFGALIEATGKVHLFSVTSEGDAHDHVGNWDDDNTLELNWRGTFEDQELEEKIIAKWLNKDQIEVKETNYILGERNSYNQLYFQKKRI